MIKVTPLPGNAKTMIAIEGTQRNWSRGIRQGFFELGRELVSDAKTAITKGPKTGKFYRVRGRKRKHRASAPGQAPANITGKLRNSVGFQISGSDRMEFGYRDSVDYGKYLERGTSRMEPRPNIGPTVDKNEKNAEVILSNNIARQIKK